MVRTLPHLRRPVVAAVLAVAAASAPSTAAGAPPERYVALGDSFSSGAGARGPVLDAGCRRTAAAYPVIVARERPRTALVFAACAGAGTADVLASQLPALTPSTRWATITAGGNDAGFADVLATCAVPAWAAHCASRISAAQAYARTVLPGRLDALYRQIRLRAPAATVLVLGYPRLLGDQDCQLLTWFSAADRRRVLAAGDLLDLVLRARAHAHGFLFRGVEQAFAGHAVCGRPAWVNGLALPLADSFHPNAAGHRAGYAPLVRAVLG